MPHTDGDVLCTAIQSSDHESRDKRRRTRMIHTVDWSTCTMQLIDCGDNKHHHDYDHQRVATHVLDIIFTFASLMDRWFIIERVCKSWSYASMNGCGWSINVPIDGHVIPRSIHSLSWLTLLGYGRTRRFTTITIDFLTMNDLYEPLICTSLVT
jgi:hypothetical protein